MELLLLAITVASLVVAFVMSVAAWRLSRKARSHASARVAALIAAASEPAVTPYPATVDESVAVNEPRSAPWPSARVSAFAPPRVSARNEDLAMRPGVADPQTGRPAAVVSDGFLGGGVLASPGGGSAQRWLAIAAVMLLAAAIAIAYFTLYGGQSMPASAAAAGPDVAPLELVSLRHERRGARLAVTGLVRNPVAGLPVDKLTAVVFLFDQQGAFVTSARADVDFLKLAPGDESPFVIAIDAPTSVARYRVSFRNDAGLVPHIDRRDQQPVAPNIVSQNTTALRYRP